MCWFYVSAVVSPLSFVTTALGRFKDVQFTKHFLPSPPPLELRGGGVEFDDARRLFDLNEPNIQLNVTISSAKYTKREPVASSRPVKVPESVFSS